MRTVPVLRLIFRRYRTAPSPETGASRGQVLVLFGLMLTFLIGLSAFVVDIAWIWSHQLKVQRAADAGALAGVVWLPGNEASAATSAKSAVTANGYTHGVGGATVTAVKDPTDPNRIKVDVSAPVETFFMRVFGWSEVTVARTARAEYVLPVPMGSPENYYGVFGPVRTPTGGTTTVNASDTGWLSPSVNKAFESGWTNVGNVYTSDNLVATATDRKAAWGDFNFSFPSGATVTGIEARIEARYSGVVKSDCRLSVRLSGENGGGYSNEIKTPNLTQTDPVSPYYVLGSSTNLWGKASDYWTVSRFTNANFRIQLERDGCNGTDSPRQVDLIQVRVHYTTSTFVPDANLAAPTGETLAPRGYWGTMLAQGSIDVNGDAYSPRYETRTSQLNAQYLPTQYYDYAVKVPAGSTDGEIWIYDPVFCATSSSGQYGTGDRFLETTNAVSAFYMVYDTKETMFDTADDTRMDPTSDDNLFKGISASDTSLGGPSGYPSCKQGDVTNTADGRYWHNRWYQLADNLPGGKTYRVRTTSTDPNSATAQLNAGAQNSFAIWTTAVGEKPDVYGIGAMEAYTPLGAGQAATFYLAKIEAIHAGKTVRIELWDPGDTQSLPANLEILIPTASGYSKATFDWTATKGSANSAAICRVASGAGVTSLTTNTGGTQNFNGCWVTIEVPIPTNYTAPAPPGETEAGWWKINYVMGGTGTTTAYDVTTWEVEIRGNPVHLVVP
jgi:hypothetical protein